MMFKKCVEISIAMGTADNDVAQLDQRENSIKYQNQMKAHAKGSKLNQSKKDDNCTMEVFCYLLLWMLGSF